MLSLARQKTNVIRFPRPVTDGVQHINISTDVSGFGFHAGDEIYIDRDMRPTGSDLVVVDDSNDPNKPEYRIGFWFNEKADRIFGVVTGRFTRLTQEVN